MIWQFCHHWLGWHYVRANLGGGHVVRRALQTPMGRPYIVLVDEMIFLDEPGDPRFQQREITPLTFSMPKLQRRSA